MEPALDVVNFFNYTAANTLRGSGAIAWTEFPERMNSIMNLFRSRQQEPSLFRTPFTDEKIKEMSAGVRADWTDGDIPPFTRAELAEVERSWRPPPFTPPPSFTPPPVTGGGVP